MEICLPYACYLVVIKSVALGHKIACLNTLHVLQNYNKMGLAFLNFQPAI